MLQESTEEDFQVTAWLGSSRKALRVMSFFSIVSSSLSPALYLGSKATWSPRYPAAGQTPVPNVSLPLRFDWRDKHVVNQVRNQKMVSFMSVCSSLSEH